ncbi:MAG: allophanate hydrolase [Thermotogae bacterium]|nr:MAG: allophanate hydrolase [Thermotogota bacterium]
MIYDNPVIKESGGYVVYIEFCTGINLNCNTCVQKLWQALMELSKSGIDGGIEEIVPAYSSLTIFYNPEKTCAEKLRKTVLQQWKKLKDKKLPLESSLWMIPVAYGGTFGPDLEEILAATKLSYESFIAVHTSKEYLCYMLGFTPGFVYLGDVDDRIALPRLKSPKSRIAPGSVGIAGKQTGIYGVESPGGWRIIGKTPIKMFDPRRSPPIAIKPGDKVRFYPVTVEQYKQMEGVYLTDLSTSQGEQNEH